MLDAETGEDAVRGPVPASVDLHLLGKIGCCLKDNRRCSTVHALAFISFLGAQMFLGAGQVKAVLSVLFSSGNFLRSPSWWWR